MPYGYKHIHTFRKRRRFEYRQSGRSFLLVFRAAPDARKTVGEARHVEMAAGQRATCQKSVKRWKISIAAYRGGGGGLSSAYAPVRPILGKEAGIMVSRAKRQQSRGPEPCCNTYIPILSSWRHKPLPWKVIGFECRPRTGFLCPVCGMPHDGRLAGRQKAM